MCCRFVSIESLEMCFCVGLTGNMSCSFVHFFSALVTAATIHRFHSRCCSYAFVTVTINLMYFLIQHAVEL